MHFLCNWCQVCIKEKEENIKKVIKFLVIFAIIFISVIIIKKDDELFDKNIEEYAKAIAEGIIEEIKKEQD